MNAISHRDESLSPGFKFLFCYPQKYIKQSESKKVTATFPRYFCSLEKLYLSKQNRFGNKMSLFTCSLLQSFIFHWVRLDFNKFSKLLLLFWLFGQIQRKIRCQPASAFNVPTLTSIKTKLFSNVCTLWVPLMLCFLAIYFIMFSHMLRMIWNEREFLRLPHTKPTTLRWGFCKEQWTTITM